MAPARVLEVEPKPPIESERDAACTLLAQVLEVEPVPQIDNKRDGLQVRHALRPTFACACVARSRNRFARRGARGAGVAPQLPSARSCRRRWPSARCCFGSCRPAGPSTRSAAWSRWTASPSGEGKCRFGTGGCGTTCAFAACVAALSAPRSAGCERVRRLSERSCVCAAFAVVLIGAGTRRTSRERRTA